jgi:hypothetical protein
MNAPVVIRIRGERIRQMPEQEAAHWLASRGFEMGDTVELYNGNVVTHWTRPQDGKQRRKVATF